MPEQLNQSVDEGALPFDDAHHAAVGAVGHRAAHPELLRMVEDESAEANRLDPPPDGRLDPDPLVHAPIIRGLTPPSAREGLRPRAYPKEGLTNGVAGSLRRGRGCAPAPTPRNCHVRAPARRQPSESGGGGLDLVDPGPQVAE